MADQITSIVVPEKPQTLVSSSSVEGYHYNDTTYELFVFYKGKAGKAGSLYRYLMVYPVVFAQIFNSGQGIGNKAQKLLKGLPYQKIR